MLVLKTEIVRDDEGAGLLLYRNPYKTNVAIGSTLDTVVNGDEPLILGPDETVTLDLKPGSPMYIRVLPKEE